MTIRERFLNAKHWQLFILFFGIPLLFEIIFMITMFASIGYEGDPNLSQMVSFFIFFPLIMILSMSIYFGWLWSLATGLQPKIPGNFRLKIKRFKIFFFIPVSYMLVLTILMTVVFSNLPRMVGHPQPINIEVMVPLMLFIFPLHIFSIFCILYCFYFVAKTIKTVELQRETSFSEFAGEFFLIWFFPIGVWFLQPRIYKIAHTEFGEINERIQ